MFTYKNTSRTTKTFHGVQFNPGDVKTVSGYINDPKFIRVKESSAVTQKPAKSSKEIKVATSTKAVVSVKTSSKSVSQKSQASNTKSKDDKVQKDQKELKEDKANG